MIKYLSIVCLILFGVGIIDERYFSLEKKLYIEAFEHRLEISIYAVPLIGFFSLLALFIFYKVVNFILNRRRNNFLNKKNQGMQALINALVCIDCLKYDCLDKNLNKAIKLFGDNRITKLSNANYLRCKNMNNEAINEYYSLIKGKNKKDFIYLSAIKGILELKNIENFSLEEIEALVNKANYIDKQNFWAKEILLYYYQINNLWHKAIGILEEFNQDENIREQKACLYAAIAKDYTAMNNDSKSAKYWRLALKNSSQNLALINEYCRYLMYHDKQIQAINWLNEVKINVVSLSIIKTYLGVLETCDADKLIKISHMIIKQISNAKNERDICVLSTVLVYIYFISKDQESLIKCIEQIKSNETSQFFIGNNNLFKKICNIKSLNDASLTFENMIKEITINNSWLCNKGCNIVYKEPQICCDSCLSVGTISYANSDSKSNFRL